MKESGLSVIIPVYNEVNGLKDLLEKVFHFCSVNGFQMIIVDDGSTDGSRLTVREYLDVQNVLVFRHKLNKGYGAALKTGFNACSTEYSITFDADGQHSVNDIRTLFDKIMTHDADLVIGSRQGMRKTSIRGVGRTLIRMIAKILMNVPVYDLNSGMKIYRTELVRKYLNLASDNMSFSDIITLIFLNNRHLVLEEPIKIWKRKHGRSSVTLETAFHTIMEVINIVILFNPMKIFLPISLLCLLTTAMWGIPLMIKGYGISTGTVLGIISGFIFFLLGLIAEQLSQIRKGNTH